jgi:SPP1 family holin
MVKWCSCCSHFFIWNSKLFELKRELQIKNLDKGTVIRTALLFIALLNQTLIMVGQPVIPIEEGQVVSLIDGLYLVGSILFSLITILSLGLKTTLLLRMAASRNK